MSYYNIVLTPSAVLWKQSMIVMLSAMINCKTNCHFYVMQSNWSNEQKEIVKKFIVSFPENDITFIDVDDKLFAAFRSWRGFHTTYYKMIAHIFLPLTVERILYLDCDLFINKDIEALYNMDFEDNYLIAATEELSLDGYIKRSESGSLHKHGFFNAGVILLNVKKFRDDNITIDFYTSYLTKLKDQEYLADQGLLNYIFYDKVKVIPSYKYNHMLYQAGSENKLYSFKHVFSLSFEERKKSVCPPYWEEMYSEEENASIVHFAGVVSKPWEIVQYIQEGKEKIFIPVLKHSLKLEDVESYYIAWWSIAKKLPYEIYMQLLYESNSTAASNCILADQYKMQLTWMTNAKNFFEKLSVDFMTDSKFVNFIRSLNDKKIVLLKSQDAAGRFLTKILQNNKTEILFSSPKPNLTKLTADEWQKCKECDVIICCDVHVTTSSERDGIKTVMLKDVLSDSTLSGKPSWSDSPVEEINDALFKIKNTDEEILDKVINLPAQFDEITKVHTQPLIKQNEELTANLSDTSLKLKTAEQQIKDLEIERDALKNRIFEMQSARSWRYTRIFRKNKKDE